MRISDWSSDVCSSDLVFPAPQFDRPCQIGDLTDHRLGIALLIDQGQRQIARHRGERVLQVNGNSDCASDNQNDGERDRKSVVQGTSVSVRVDIVVRLLFKKKK